MRVRIGGQSAWMASANGLSAPALPFGGGAGKLVGALVLRVSRMSLHPLPVNAMGAGGLKQGLPQLGILHRLAIRSEEHTSELQSLMRISYAVFCLKKKTTQI